MKTLSTRRWFPRAFRFLDKVADLVRPAKAKRNAAQLRFLSLETRVVPATSIAMIDAVAYTGKTVAVRVTHDQTAGSVEGIVRWGDGTTVDFGSWSHTLSSKTFTHTYSSAGKFAVTTENKSSVVEDTEAVTVNANIPPSMPVDGGLGLEWGKSATPVPLPETSSPLKPE